MSKSNLDFDTWVTIIGFILSIFIIGAIIIDLVKNYIWG